MKSGCRISSRPDGARSSILTNSSAASCCSSLGCINAGKLLNEGNWNSRTSSAKGSTLKYNESAYQKRSSIPFFSDIYQKKVRRKMYLDIQYHSSPICWVSRHRPRRSPVLVSKHIALLPLCPFPSLLLLVQKQQQWLFYCQVQQ